MIDRMRNLTFNSSQSRSSEADIGRVAEFVVNGQPASVGAVEDVKSSTAENSVQFASRVVFGNFFEFGRILVLEGFGDAIRADREELVQEEPVLDQHLVVSAFLNIYQRFDGAVIRVVDLCFENEGIAAGLISLP